MQIYGKEHEGMNDNSSMKGKGKAPDSLVTRIAASASGLAKDVVGSSNSLDASETLTTAVSSSQKASSSSSASSSRWSESLPSRTTWISNQHSQGDLPSREGFRSAPQGNMISAEFTQFSQNHGLPYGASQHNVSGSSFLVSDFKRAQNHAFQAEPLKPSTSDRGVLPIDFKHDDGAEVRALLSTPGAFDWMDTADFSADDPMSETISDLFGEPFSETEQQIAHRLKSSLPQPPTHFTMPSDHPLNLRLDFMPLGNDRQSFVRDFDALTESLELITGNKYFDNDQKDYLLSEWDSVLNNYADEVWGDMLPAVNEAKNQMKELRTSDEKLDNNAVARLRMILGHLSCAQHDDQFNVRQNAANIRESSSSDGHEHKDIQEQNVTPSFARSFIQRNGLQDLQDRVDSAQTDDLIKKSTVAEATKAGEE